jgi:hypothetical protein
MGSKTPEEIQGYEYDWLACDRDGRVAMFSTAGGGYAPKAFLAETDKYDAALDALKQRAPFTSACMAPPVAEGLANIWKDLAERGLFSYDSDPTGGPYRLVGAPTVPLRAPELDSSIADVVQRVVLIEIQLGQDTVVTREDIVQSESE